MNNAEEVAHAILSMMVTRFGVRPNGSVHISSLAVAALARHNIAEVELQAGIKYAVEKGWVIQQENGLIRISDTGFAEA